MRSDFASLVSFTDLERDVNHAVIRQLEQKCERLTIQVRGVSNILNTPRLCEIFRRKMAVRKAMAANIEEMVIENNLLDSQYVSTSANYDGSKEYPPSLFKTINSSKANREMTGISMFDSRLDDKSKFRDS